jgi:hypothetical protein
MFIGKQYHWIGTWCKEWSVFYSNKQLMFGKEIHIDPVGKAQKNHSNMCAIEQLNNWTTSRKETDSSVTVVWREFLM